MTQPASRIRRAPSDPPGKPRSRFAISRWAPAAPALLMMVVVVLIGIAAWAQRPDVIDAQYRHDADTAVQSRDFETAHICYQRLLQRSPNDPALLFGLAKCLAELEHPADAAQIIRRLAPADSAGYAPAQVLVAEQILSGPADAKALQLARAHVQRALESDPNNGEALLLLNQIYAKTPAH